MHKAPCNCGCIVSKDGLIKEAWHWRGEGNCPSIFELEEGDVFYELDHATHDAICKDLHKLKVEKNKIVLKEPSTPQAEQ